MTTIIKFRVLEDFEQPQLQVGPSTFQHSAYCKGSTYSIAAGVPIVRETRDRLVDELVHPVTGAVLPEGTTEIPPEETVLYALACQWRDAGKVELLAAGAVAPEDLAKTEGTGEVRDAEGNVVRDAVTIKPSDVGDAADILGLKK